MSYSAKIIENIDRALAEIKAPSGSFRRCDQTVAEAVIEKAKSTFVDGTPSIWWFSLKHQVSNQHYEDGGFFHLIETLPLPEAIGWLIPELHGEDHLVYEVNISLLTDVLGNSTAFEYYLVGKDFTWLIAETDADQLITCVAHRSLK